MLRNLKGVKKTMRNWILAMFIVLLLGMGTASAFTSTDYQRDTVNDRVVANLHGTWTDACAVFTWDAASSADFNNYVVSTTSNNASFNGVDTNTKANSIVFCTLQDSEWVKAIVYRIDGNVDGFFMNDYPDVNATINPGTMVQAGQYLVYQVMIAIAAIVSLVIIVLVTIVILAKLGINVKFFK